MKEEVCEIAAEKNVPKGEELDVFLESTWGIDGTTGQAQLNQTDANGNQVKDGGLLIASMAPVRVTFRRENEEIIYVWKNPTPGSRLWNRPIGFENQKETDESIKAMHKNIQDQIDELTTFSFENDTFGNYKVKITPIFYLSMVDGKTIKVLTNTKSYQRCVCCDATPQQMNNMENFENGTFAMKTKDIEPTISPLHSTMLGVMFLYHIGCKKTIKSWKVSKENRAEFEREKAKVTAAIDGEFKVKFNQPRIGGSGTSTTGGMCRQILKRPDDFARVLGIDQDLVRKFSTILRVLNCQEEIDEVKFEKFARETYAKCVELYPWYYIPATMHKILAHGAEIIRMLPLPPGVMTEEGLESNNKIFPYFSQHHARNTSRIDRNRDIFERMYFMSKPLYVHLKTSIFSVKTKNDELSDEIRSLLKNQIDENGDEDQRIYSGDNFIPPLETYDEPLENFNENEF